MPVIRPGEQTHFQCEARLRGTVGVLTITNHRIVVTRVSGLVSKRESNMLDLPLLAVEEISVERRLRRGFLVVRARGEGYAGPPRVEIDVEQPAETKRLISGLVEARRRELAMSIAASAPHPAPHVSVTIHQPPAPIAPPKIMVRCTFCRTVFPELDAKCPNCGASF